MPALFSGSPTGGEIYSERTLFGIGNLSDSALENLSVLVHLSFRVPSDKVKIILIY